MGNSVLRALFGKKQVRVLMLGLDNAGKTTILHHMKGDNNYESIPTVGFNVETVKLRNITLNVWDVGGQDKIRPLWRHYFTGTDALIYVVDSTDLNRMEEAKAEFLRIVTDNQMAHAAVLIFANKSDLPKAASAPEVAELLGVQEMAAERDGRAWHIQQSCAKSGEGLPQGIEWLSEQLLASNAKKKKKKTPKPADS